MEFSLNTVRLLSYNRAVHQLTHVALVIAICLAVTACPSRRFHGETSPDELKNTTFGPGDPQGLMVMDIHTQYEMPEGVQSVSHAISPIVLVWIPEPTRPGVVKEIHISKNFNESSFFAKADAGRYRLARVEASQTRYQATGTLAGGSKTISKRINISGKSDTIDVQPGQISFGRTYILHVPVRKESNLFAADEWVADVLNARISRGNEPEVERLAGKLASFPGIDPKLYAR